MEKYEEYVDALGNRYVAADAAEYGYANWIDSMVNSYSLDELVMMFPYCCLKADPQGFLIPVDGNNFMGKITNKFHILHARMQDKYRPRKTIDTTKDFYSLDISTHVPDKDIVIERNISFPTPDKMVLKKEDCYVPDYEHMPEEIVIQSIPNGWHPNKDARGYYMSPNQYTGYGNPYQGAGWYGYNPYYYGGGGYVGSPNPYSYQAYPWSNPTNLPQYKSGYPF